MEKIFWKKLKNMELMLFYRSSKLAECDTKTIDVLLNCLEELNMYSGIVIFLQPTSPLRTHLKNRVDEPIEQVVMTYAIKQPVHGQHRTSNKLRKKGIFVLGSGVRSIWLRYNLENFKKRLKALE